MVIIILKKNVNIDSSNSNPKKTTSFKKTLRKSLYISGIYMLFGSIWIVVTDMLSSVLFFDNILQTSIIKGLFYVLISSLLIYLLVYSSFKKNYIMQEKLLDVNTELEKANILLKEDKSLLINSENKLKVGQELFRTVFNSATIGIAISKTNKALTSKNEFVYTNFMFQEITGTKIDSSIDDDYLDKLYSDDLIHIYKEMIGKQPSDYAIYDMDEQYIKPDGLAIWIHIKISHISFNGFKNEYFLFIVEDITKRKNDEINMRYLNDHNVISGLFNRKVFNEIINNQSSENIKSTFMLINLKSFNLLNAIHGYSICEKLIKDIGVHLKKYSSDESELFHVATDRFVFYLKNKSHTEIMNLSKKISESLSSEFESHTFGGNIGILELENEICDPETILKNISIAAENSENNQTFSVNFFNDAMEHKINREADIKNELSAVVYNDEDNRLYLNYQPIIDLYTNKIRGFEALARFNSVKFDNVSPYEFIPIAEKSQLIIPLGLRVMRMSLTFAKKLEQLYNNLFISINVSAIQLFDDEFVNELIKTINILNIDYNKVVLEITETYFFEEYKE